MKKAVRYISALLAVLLFSAFLCACDSETAQKLETLPFHEGYYKGENFTVMLEYVGSDTECAYNIWIYNNDTGVCYFKSSSLGLSGTTPGMHFFNDAVAGETVAFMKNEAGGNYKISGGTFFDGEYTYGGTEWQSKYDIIKSQISPGSYSKDGYKLEISETEGKLVFYIRGDMTSGVYYGEAKSTKTDRLTINNDEGDTTFTVSGDEHGTYITVTDQVKGSERAYFGTYTLDGCDFISAGTYALDDTVIQVKRYRDKSDFTAYKAIIEVIVTEGENTVATESISLGMSERTHLLELNDGNLKLFKALGDDGEYIDVLKNDCGIKCGRYVKIK